MNTPDIKFSGVQVPDQKFIKAYANPLRQKILKFLKDNGPATQTELAKHLDMEPASARHHLMRLLDVGMTRKAGTRPGPKGITEILFVNTSKGTGYATPFLTRPGTEQDFMMRKFKLDEFAEAHRVGTRVVLRSKNPHFSLASDDVVATDSRMRGFFMKIYGLLLELAKNPSAEPGAKKFKVQLAFYPQSVSDGPMPDLKPGEGNVICANCVDDAPAPRPKRPARRAK